MFLVSTKLIYQLYAGLQLHEFSSISWNNKLKWPIHRVLKPEKTQGPKSDVQLYIQFLLIFDMALLDSTLQLFFVHSHAPLRRGGRRGNTHTK